jgi:hypothetical protein
MKVISLLDNPFLLYVLWLVLFLLRSYIIRYFFMFINTLTMFMKENETNKHPLSSNFMLRVLIKKSNEEIFPLFNWHLLFITYKYI